MGDQEQPDTVPALKPENEDIANENNENPNNISITSETSLPQAETTAGVEKTENVSTSEKSQDGSSLAKKNESSWVKCALVVVPIVIGLLWSIGNSDTPPTENNWRDSVDPNTKLSIEQRSTIRASLKLILEKPSTNDYDTVSTLLILSPNEENAFNIASCILQLINTESSLKRTSTEFDLKKYRENKLHLDTSLKYVFEKDDKIKGVVFRNIDGIVSHNDFGQLQLLFAYCDGENPVISNRLMIMTATSTSHNESELRQKFKNRWTTEEDFIDALMSRISGHTIFVENDQESIC